MLAKNRLATAVAVGLGASLIGAASADNAFFPYLALGTQVTTVVSVMNTGANNWTQNGGVVTGGQVGKGNLHYRMYYKQVNGQGDNAKVCQEVNTYLPTSQYDIQSIDIGAHFGATTKGVLFNDPSVNNNWKASGKDYALGRTLGNARAYLVVDNAESGSSGASTVTGEAFVFDYVAGAVFGYQASTGYGSDTSYWGEIHTAAPNPSTITVLPLAETTTAIFVTPLANAPTIQTDSQGMTPFGGNSYESTIALWTYGSYALYDRDENLVSGSTPAVVRCVGRVDMTDLISLGAQAYLPDGGWGSIANQRTNTIDVVFPNKPEVAFDPTTAYPLGETSLIKLEYNLTGTFNGEAIPGLYNNGFRILGAPDPVAP